MAVTGLSELPEEVNFMHRSMGKGADLSPPLQLRLLPLIAHWPVMARWNRDAESIYKLQETKRNHVILRSQAIEGQAPFDPFKQ